MLKGILTLTATVDGMAYQTILQDNLGKINDVSVLSTTIYRTGDTVKGLVIFIGFWCCIIAGGVIDYYFGSLYVGTEGIIIT